MYRAPTPSVGLFTLLAFIALASVLASCGSEPGTNNAVTLECSIDGDCRGERVCRQGICTLTESEPRRLGFRLTPPPASTFPPQTVPIRAIRSDEPVQIGLEPAVRVAGRITWAASDAGPGTGRLKFKRIGTNENFSAEAAVEGDAYETFVPAGTYDVTFFPDDPERPPHIWRRVEVELDTDPRLQLARDKVEIRGTLSRTDAISNESAVVAGARVFAISRQTQATSSASVTGESGDFSFFVTPDSGVYDLHVAPVEPNSFTASEAVTYIPEAKFDRAFEVRDPGWINLLDETQQADVLSLSLGEYGYAPVRFPFQLVADALDDISWEGTTVTLRTAAGLGVISVRQRVEESGTFEIPLVLGEYEATVRTPPNSPIGSTQFTELTLDETGIQLELPLRERVAGTVKAPDGTQIGAELTFQPVDAAALAEQVTVLADEAGAFEAWLDDVEYLVSVTPSDPTLPRWIVSATPDELPETINIAEPVLVWGTVLGTPTPGGSNNGSDWRQLPDVNVRVIERDAEDRQRVVGEGQTDERGEFKVVIGVR